jgi:hypothetical protein
MSTVLEHAPVPGEHPLKAAAEATKQERRSRLRAVLLVALLPLAYLPFYFENVAAGWAAFAACLAGAAILAAPLAKKLFTPFDALFEAKTGCNYTTAVSGSRVPRDKARDVEEFLAAHGSPVVSRRATQMNVVALGVAAGFALLFTALTVLDYRAGMSREIVVRLPEGFEPLQQQITAEQPQPGGLRPEGTVARREPPPTRGRRSPRRPSRRRTFFARSKTWPRTRPTRGRRKTSSTRPRRSWRSW